MASKAILVLLLHIVSTAADMSGDGRRRKLEEEHGMRFDFSFSSGFEIGYVFSLVSIVTIFMSYCVPWPDIKQINKTKKNMMNTPSLMTLLMARPQILGEKMKNRSLQHFVVNCQYLGEPNSNILWLLDHLSSNTTVDFELRQILVQYFFLLGFESSLIKHYHIRI
ncbi:uncharacterized protein LOC131170581 [Hevea brasiliensis]|uniref:uncharacterized protein LOC131170581 n=1 Tax=Hevea brasiliensis TaxID=3981 RepID=UPI0025EE84AA|nr:uncharacterized protein LOC131170581 [Hevea brasiliensis]